MPCTAKTIGKNNDQKTYFPNNVFFFATASVVFSSRSVAACWKDAKPSLPEYKRQLFTSATSRKRTFVLPGRARLLLAHMCCLDISGRPPLRDITKIRKQTDYIEPRGLPQVVPPSAWVPAHLMLSSIWKWMFCVCSQLVCAWRTPGPARSLPSESFSDAFSICLNIMMAAAKRNEHLSEGANTHLHIDGVHALVHPWLFQSPALI